jgi:hypothetical protein
MTPADFAWMVFGATWLIGAFSQGTHTTPPIDRVPGCTRRSLAGAPNRGRQPVYCLILVAVCSLLLNPTLNAGPLAWRAVPENRSSTGPAA